MKAEDLLNSVEVLKKIKSKQDEIDKVNAKLQNELGELVSELPPALRAMVNENGGTKSSGEKRERVTLSGDDKTHIRDAARDVLKKAKDGAKFGELMTALQKALPTI